MPAKRQRVIETPPGFTDNTGKRPTDIEGKRAIVILRNGHRCGDVPVSDTAKPGWDVKTTRWTIIGAAHDVRFFKLL